jgi:hypothetical protein
MPLKIYKPNKSKTGHAASFSFSSKQEALYIEFIKQTDYNEERHIGSFKNGDKTRIKLNMPEIGSIIHAWASKTPFRTVHTSPDRSLSLSADVWRDKTNEKIIKGYTISVSFKDGGADKKFGIALSPGEMYMAVEYFKFFMSRCFSAIHTEDKKVFERRGTDPSKGSHQDIKSDPSEDGEANLAAVEVQELF